MAIIGGFAWLGVGVPVAILIGGGSATIQIRNEPKAAVDPTRASMVVTKKAGEPNMLRRAAPGGRPARLEPLPELARTRRGSSGSAAKAVRGGDPRTRSEVLAGLDRLIANVEGLLDEGDVATLQCIRDNAALSLPADRSAAGPLRPLEMAAAPDICIDPLPGALKYHIALPA